MCCIQPTKNTANSYLKAPQLENRKFNCDLVENGGQVFDLFHISPVGDEREDECDKRNRAAEHGDKGEDALVALEARQVDEARGREAVHPGRVERVHGAVGAQHIAPPPLTGALPPESLGGALLPPAITTPLDAKPVHRTTPAIPNPLDLQTALYTPIFTAPGRTLFVFT